MSDDRLIRANEREVFEAVISQLADPEVVRLQRILVTVGVTLIVLGVVAVSVVGALRWTELGAFCATFVPGMIVARRTLGRRLSGSSEPRRRRRL